MKITVERTALAKALGHLHRIVEKRNTIPILSNVLLQADGSRLMLKATDLDIEVTEQIAAEIHEPGDITLAAHILNDIVRKLPNGAQISIDAPPEKQTVLKSGKARFNLQSLPAQDFPNIAAGQFEQSFRIRGGDLRQLLDKAQFAISSEETRYYLNGVYMHVAEVEGREVLRAVATDGHRLARLEIPAPAGSPGMPGIIVPRKTVSEIIKLIEDNNAEIEVDVSTTKIRFTIGNVVMTSKLIDGTFPDYARVIPSGNPNVMTVDCQAFKAAVDRVSTVSADRGRAVKLAAQEGAVTLSVQDAESGSCEEEFGCEYEGAPIGIGFNHRYVNDALTNLGETAQFRFSDPGSPAIVADPADPSLLIVLMPMRV